MKPLILTLLFGSGCAWYQAQWAKPKDKCATEICPAFAADNLMTATGGEYDTEAQACACALIDDEHRTVLEIVPMH